LTAYMMSALTCPHPAHHVAVVLCFNIKANNGLLRESDW